MYKIKTESFEGPLSLLLNLIEQEKLDITGVSLASIAGQYLERIDKMGENINTSELADFLVVASRLLAIKSRVLIPSDVFCEDSEGDLENQLKMYKAYKDASENIRSIISKGRFSFARAGFKFHKEIEFYPPKNFAIQDMLFAMRRVISQMEEIFISLPKKSIKKIISLSEKISRLKFILEKAQRIMFKDFIKSVTTKSEIIVSFLALLELAKQRRLTADQEDNSDIIILSKNQCH